MNLLEKIFTIGRVLRAGESLKDPKGWKEKQIVFNAVLIILGAIPQFINIDVSESDLNAISYGIATVMGLLNTYLTAATSDKVGMSTKSKD